MDVGPDVPRLFRFQGERWLDLGYGRAMLVPNAANGVKFVFQLCETNVIVTNHTIISDGDHCNLRPNAGNECCWAWSAQEESSDRGALCSQWFALKFSTKQFADSFRDAFDRAKAFNRLVTGVGQQREVSSEGSKIYTFNDKHQWDEAVPGRAKILLDRAAGTTSFSFTSGNSSQIVTQHDIVQHDTLCKLQPNAGSEVCWTWGAHVGHNSHVDATHLALKFVDSELAAKFKASFDYARSLASQAGDFAGEQEIYSVPGKLHRWCNGNWQQQGSGEARLLRHSKLLKIRFVFHKAKTAQVLAYHFMARHESLCNLKHNAKRDDCWTWSAYDVAEGAPCEQQFALKFENAAKAIKFKEAADLAMEFVPAVQKLPFGSSATKPASVEASILHGSGDAAVGKSRVGGFSVTLTRSDLAGSQQHFLLRAEPRNSAIRIGRAPECECRMMIPGISANHVELRLMSSSCTLQDGGVGTLSVCDLSTNGTALQHPGHAPELLERDVSAALQDGSTLIIPAKTKSRKEAGAQRVHILVKFAALAPSKTAQWQVANGVGSGDPTTTMEESFALQQQPHLPGEDTFTPPSIDGTEQRLAAARAMLAQAQADTSALSSSVQQVNSSPPLGNGLALSIEECGKPNHHGVQANALPVTGMTTKARAPLPCPYSPPPPPPPPRPKFFLPTPAPAAFPREKSSPMNKSMPKVPPPSYLVAEVLETMAPQKMTASRTNGYHHSDSSTESPNYRGCRRGERSRKGQRNRRSRSRRRSRKLGAATTAQHSNQPSEGHGTRLVAVKGLNKRPNLLPAPRGMTHESCIAGGPEVSVWPPVPQIGTRPFLA
jgi:hypothetical protein